MKRLTVRRLMILAVLVALPLAWVASNRRLQKQSLQYALKSHETRLKWGEIMHRKGYVSKASLLKEQTRRDAVERELKAMGGVAKP